MPFRAGALLVLPVAQSVLWPIQKVLFADALVLADPAVVSQLVAGRTLLVILQEKVVVSGKGEGVWVGCGGYEQRREEEEQWVHFADLEHFTWI